MAVSGGERVLVLDSEILIAMEVAQMLEDGMACTALAASWLTFDAGQSAPGFDAIVMDCEYVPEAIAEARQSLQTAKAEVEKQISLIRADDPELARIGVEQGNVIVAALDSVDVELARATGL